MQSSRTIGNRNRIGIIGALCVAAWVAAGARADVIDGISGLTLHLRASDLNLSDGASVSGWGSLTAVGGAQPTYDADAFFGKPAVVFDGADDVLQWTGANLTARTVFMVADVTTGGGSLDTAISNGGDSRNVRRDGTSLFYRSPGHGIDGGDLANGGSFSVNNVASGQFVIDQHHLVQAVSASNQTYTNLVVGDSGNGLNRYWTGAIAEVVVFDRVLTAAEQQAVVAQLSRTYGMSYNYLVDTIDQLGATATASAQKVTEPASNAIDNNTGTKWFTDPVASTPQTLTIRYNGQQVRPVHAYTIASANDADTRDPATWTLEGSNDGSTWTTLDSRSGVDFTQRFQTLHFTAENRQSFEYYRFAITPSGGNDVQLSEVQLFSLDNVAQGKAATQSTTHSPYAAANAVNGSTTDFSHTSGSDSGPWWMVDLDGPNVLESIVIHNRDDCCGGRLRDITVELLDGAGQVTWVSDLLNAGNIDGGGVGDFTNGPKFLEIIFDGVGEVASFIRISRATLPGGGDNNNVLALGEVQAFGYIFIPTPAALPAGLALMTLATLRGRRRRR